ncbi:fatty acid--CoA ligase family protein [Aquibacillus sp. 3ASR75-11]|uniref:Fatty acid--CoA ligase family protein n=1 Tax=Terrihalobacillus insolitus TaxID=2950438 RepID=A0A9X3WYE5_9BACI|nr:fatty acid--CoA ligase family protein [Terrihalobacillus insolitus]MDC3413740.1 fatty acid--CoA ligase family protein [Terrihalobacillus insolitus]MDC3425599.1 fatty acid--CoA ligase family protein [Terrihalobacillus insolitus]
MNLADQLSVIAKEKPNKVAYVFHNAETTYQELEGAVTKFASSLKKLGYEKGDHLALVTGNSPHFIIGLYGAIRIGVTVIPINPIYTPDEIGYILKDGDVKGVITMDLFVKSFEGFVDTIPSIEHYIIVETGANDLTGSSISDKMQSFSQLVQDGELEKDRLQLNDHDVAVILYTSGTTGKPKGAMLTNKNLYSNAKDTADYLNINEGDRVIAALPMFHVFCLTVSLNAPLMNGGTILIVSKFSPQAVFEIARKQQATVFAGVPTMYNYLLQTPGEHVKDLETIRLCISGGAAMPVALLEKFEQKFNVTVSEGYGLSEASPVTCFNPLDRPRKPGSIGTSIMNVENKVVDELGEELPVGEVGELVVKGPNVMTGYYKMPEETAVTLKNGWLYTGDMARMDDDGYFYIVDRKKDMILVGGYNVYPREVEEVLYSHPDISEVAVVGLPDADTGEAVAGYIVTKNNALTEQDLKAFCQERLAKYKVPQKIEFLEELPKNTTGKILRRNLREKVNK